MFMHTGGSRILVITCGALSPTILCAFMGQVFQNYSRINEYNFSRGGEICSQAAPGVTGMMTLMKNAGRQNPFPWDT